MEANAPPAPQPPPRRRWPSAAVSSSAQCLVGASSSSPGRLPRRKARAVSHLALPFSLKVGDSPAPAMAAAVKLDVGLDTAKCSSKCSRSLVNLPPAEAHAESQVRASAAESGAEWEQQSQESIHAVCRCLMSVRART